MTDMRKQKKPYIIPSQPQVLLEVVKLLGSNDATVDRLVAIMMKDVSLYTACIASANTPVFGGKGRVSSLKEALMRIGFNKMLTILRLLSLKNSFSKTLDLEKFWETATEVAELTVSISKKISSGSPDEAYSLGMMHNCGIPMMLEAVDGYQLFIDGIDTCIVNTWLEAESDIFGMTHIQISYEISERWLMPKNVTNAIILQATSIKNLGLESSDNESVKLLLCSLILAKDISNAYRSHWHVSEAQQNHSELGLILAFVGISETDYTDMREEYLQNLAVKNE
ncbi:MAG: HDOD domain-containing protein [Oceanospirillaceae bacterium]|nr:HDOD domain-containing protein [Oceanospirillaceae bacterium]